MSWLWLRSRERRLEWTASRKSSGTREMKLWLASSSWIRGGADTTRPEVTYGSDVGGGLENMPTSVFSSLKMHDYKSILMDL